MVVRASADEPRRDSGDPSDSAPPPPAGAYAGWWTRADAAAALAVAAERDGDDDAVRLEDASRALSPPAAPWLEMLELSATFGAAGGGLAALLLQETALVALVAALPLVAYGARAKRDALARRFAAEALLEAREETECARRKTASLVSAADVASAAANEAVRLSSSRTSRAVDAAVDKGVGAIKRDLAVLGSGVAESRRASREVARATEALSLDIKSASASALRAAKESGSVAGMLAKDVAASRVDAREAFDLLAGLLAETDEKTARRDGETKDEVAFELGVVAEAVGNLEKSLAKLKSTNDVVSVESSKTSNTSSATTSSKTNESAKTREEEEASSALTARSLDTLARAAIAAKAAASAAERAAAAAEKASSSADVVSVRNDDAYDNARDRYPRDPVVAKLDAEQWSLLGARLTQLEEAAGEAVGRVRAGVREDIRGASDALAAAAEAAVETPKTDGGTRRRRLGRDEDDDLDSKNDTNDLSGVSKPSSDDTSTGEEASPFGLPFEFAERVAVPASFSKAAAASAFGRIAAEAAMREDSKERLEGRSRDGDGLPPINAAVGLTKEAAFQNMQALLREKSDETPEDTPEEEEEEKEEEDWSARPVRVSLATGRDGRVVATLATRGEKGAESSVDEIEPSTPTDSSGFATDDGTSSAETELARLAVGGDEENAEENAPEENVFVSARARLDEGLTSLRAARLAARDAGSNPTRMLEADADAAAAVANLEAAAEAFDRLASDANDAGPNENDERRIFAGAAAARGNLGNALLARGRLQVRLSSMAASQERRASLAGVRAGAEGAAAFHAEIAEECLVLAGRAFRKTLASRVPFEGSERDSDSDSEREMPKRNAEKRSAGAARALTGWGAALALRGDAALASASRRRDASLASRTKAENKSENDVTDADVAYAVSASEAAALAAAASEKYRAALELESENSENDESRFVFTAETRARAFTDWGDALRLAARAAASALAATSGPGFEPGRGQEFVSVFDAARLPPPGECWARAEACYEEALRWDAEGCGEDARRGLRACAEAFR